MREKSIFSFRRMMIIITVVSIHLFLTTSVTQSGQSQDVFRAGTAKIDITPTKPVRMSGYANRKGLSEGVHDPLSARIIAFKVNGKRLVLVSTDLIGFNNGTAEQFRKSILDEFKLEPGELLLSGIHTHAGPSLTIDKEKGHSNNLEYTLNLKNKLVEAIGKALNNMSQAKIGVGVGYCPIGANRRELTFDGLGNSSIKLGRNPYGPTDKEVLVIKVIKPDDAIIAAAFDYATHATCLGSKNYIISGDVLGLSEQFVEKVLGDDTIAPAFAGASGNINPWFRAISGFNTEPGWIPEPVLLGTMLGEEVVHVLRDIKKVYNGGEIKTAFTTIELPGKPKNEVTVTKDCPPTPLNITVARIGLPPRLATEDAGAGDIAFVGIGCEVLTEIGMSIKAASPYKYTFVITHCNGDADYLPPKHLYIEGGYEINSSPFAPQAADMVVNQAVKMLHEL